VKRLMPVTSVGVSLSGFARLKSANLFHAQVQIGFPSALTMAAAASCLIVGGAAGSPLQAHTPIQPFLPSFSALVERVAPAVVSVRVKANPAAIAHRDFDEEDGEPGESGETFRNGPLERYFPRPGNSSRHLNNPRKGAVAPAPVQGQGSGFFISADGYAVTNHHVVEGAIKVEIVTAKGDILPARIAGTDPATDLALLKTECEGACPFAALSRAEVKPGDWAIALGNPFGLGGTVTAGIVSARGRDIGMGAYDDFVQIDAPVNKGNSGGPTFNQSGEVIGVNTAIFSPSGGSAGVAFAIPSRTVQNVITQLKEHGRVTRGWLGVQVQPVTPELADSLGLKEAKGALVSAPSEGSPAAAAGIKRTDVIVKIGNADIKDGRELARTVSEIAPGTPVRIAIFRKGRLQVIEVKLSELKDEIKPELPSPDLSQQIEIESLGVNVVPGRGDGKGSPKGLAVLDINPNGKGADAGLVQGDIILSANETDVATPSELTGALEAARTGGKKHVLAFIQRGATQVFVALPAGS
jgi:serine protease Do